MRVCNGPSSLTSDTVSSSEASKRCCGLVPPAVNYSFQTCSCYSSISCVLLRVNVQLWRACTDTRAHGSKERMPCALLYQSAPYSGESGSLTKSKARLAASKLPSLPPPATVLRSSRIFPTPATNLYSPGQHLSFPHILF